MPKRAASTPFHIAERAVISLYDGGVLSPAVLERVIGAFVLAGVDWHSAPTLRSVDDRSLHDIVVSTMLPGGAPESVLDSFLAIVEHLCGKPARGAREKPDSPDEDVDGDGGELLAQLSGSARPATRRRANDSGGAKRVRKSAGFNPFLNAALPRRK
jgi:hypothetical protein